MLTETPETWDYPLTHWFNRLLDGAGEGVDPDYEAEQANDNYEVENE